MLFEPKQTARRTRVVYLFDSPVAIPDWPDGWSIGGVDLSPEVSVLLLGGGVGIWCPLRNLEAIAPVAPDFRAALLNGQHPMDFEPSQSATAPEETLSSTFTKALDRIRERGREGHEANLRRQLTWLGVQEGEIFALQTIGEPSHLALARSVDEAVRLTTRDGLVATNRWGKVEPLQYQGVYIIANRLVGRLDEVFVPGRWDIMPKGIITDERILVRREMYLDLDTQRFDREGNPVALPISATRDELHRTIARAVGIHEDVVAALHAIGIDRAIDVVAWMMSGNGIQFWFALADLLERQLLRDTIRELLAIWCVLYDDTSSHVDVTVFDAKRIGPCAGTPKRKGVKTELHRLVTFEGATSPRRLTIEELQSLVSYYRRRLTGEQRTAVGKLLNVRGAPPKAPAAARPAGGLTACNEIAIRDVASRLGIDPDRPLCPGCGSGGGTSDVAFLDERNVLNCKHSRCSARPNRTPVDLVAKVLCDCDAIQGTKGIVTKILAWFGTNFDVRGRS